MRTRRGRDRSVLRVGLFLLTALMLLSLIPGTAAPVAASPPVAQTVREEACDPSASVDADDIVRVIVTLEGSPTSRGGSERRLQRRRDDALASLRRIAPDLQVRHRFDYLLNGVSIDCRRGDLEALATCPGVVSVEEAAMFYPLVSSVGPALGVPALRQWSGQTGAGQVIAIVDTGVDPDHPMMCLSPDTEPALSEADVLEAIRRYDLPGSYKTAKIPYGYNYADLDDDCSSGEKDHGLHVAGIAAGNDLFAPAESRLTGLAPEAQILAMRVFATEDDRAPADNIIRAIEDAVKLGADVINLSLGSYGGLAGDGTGYAKAIEHASAAGVLVVCAAGNEGHAMANKIENKNTYGGMIQEDPVFRDIGVVANPAVQPTALAVASSVNASVRRHIFYLNEKHDASMFTYHAQATPAPDEAFHDLVPIPGKGAPEDYETDVTGAYVLVERGEITFAEKAQHAADKGAAGIIIYDNDPAGTALIMTDVEKAGIFAAYVTRDTGLALLSAHEADGSATVSFSSEARIFSDPDAGRLSDFSSWGPTPDFAFKPELTAPGENIYSAVRGGGYGTHSGTSMAAPAVAGAAALLNAELKADGVRLESRDRATALKTLLMTTSEPILNAEGVAYSPRKQGAGMTCVDRAARARVLASVNGKPSFTDRKVTGPVDLTVVLENLSGEPIAFDYLPSPVLTEAPDADLELKSAIAPEATVTLKTEDLTVLPYGKKRVTFTIDPAGIRHNFAEGYLRLRAANEDDLILTIPYVLYVGNWDLDMPIFDTVQTDGNQSLFYRLSEDDPNGLTGLYTPGIVSGMRHLLGDADPEKASPDRFTLGISNDDAALRQTAYMQHGLLRGVAEIDYYVSDSADPTDPPLLQLDHRDNVRRHAINAWLQGNITRLSSQAAYGWNGRRYDPMTKDWIKVADGQYYMHASASVAPGGERQYLTIPLKVDSVKPELRLTETPFNDAETGELVLRFCATDDFVGTSPAFIDAYINEEPMRESEGLVVKKVLDKEQGLYEYRFPGVDLTRRQHLKLICYDFASNYTDLIQEIGAEDYIILKSRTGRQMYESTYYTNRNKFQCEVLHSDTIAAVELNGVRLEPDADGRLLFETTLDPGLNTIAAVGYDAAESVRLNEPTLLMIDFNKTKPVFTLTGPGELIKHGRTNVLLIPDELADRETIVLAATCSDDVTPNEELVTQTVYPGAKGIDSILTHEVAADGTVEIETPLVLHEKQYMTQLADRHGNKASFRYQIALASERDDLETLLNPPKPPKEPSPELSFYEIPVPHVPAEGEPEGTVYRTALAPETIIGIELVDDTLPIRGRLIDLAAVEIDGERMVLDRRGYFTHSLTLEEGMNEFSVKTYQASEDDPETETVYKILKMRVRYDKTNPQATLATSPKAYDLPEVDPDYEVIYTNASGLVTVSGTATDLGFGLRVYVNGGLLAHVDDFYRAGQTIDFTHDTVTPDGGFIRVTIVDSVGHSFEKIYRVRYDVTPPEVVIDGPEDGAEIRYKGEGYPPAFRATASDDLTGDELVIEETLNGEPYHGEPITEPGTHVYTVRVIDGAGNETVETRMITILNAAPVIHLPDTWHVMTEGEMFDPLEGVTADDLEDGDLTDQLVVSGDVNSESPGVYLLAYSVKDSAGQRSVASRTVQVKGRPVIYAEDATLPYGSELDLRRLATAFDYEDGDLSEHIEVLNEVPRTTPGIYDVTFAVTDSDGNRAEKTIRVTIEAPTAPPGPPETTPIDPGDPIPLVPTEPGLTDTPVTGERNGHVIPWLGLLMGAVLLAMRKRVRRDEA